MKKPFWKTSEFWGTVLTTVSAVAGAVAGVVTGPVAGIIAAVSTGAYAISRGLTKSSGK